MVVESEPAVYDGIVGVVCLEQMLEGPRPLVRCRLYIVDLHRVQINSQMGALTPTEEGWQRYSRQVEHFAMVLGNPRRSCGEDEQGRARAAPCPMWHDVRCLACPALAGLGGVAFCMLDNTTLNA